MTGAVVELRGIASRVGVTHHPSTGSPIKITSRAFDAVRYCSVPLLLSHQPAFPIATAKIWPALAGHLAFRAVVRRGPETDAVLGRIESGQLCEVSVRHTVKRRSSYVTEDNEWVELIDRADISEVSLVECGACPGCRVWLADSDPDSLPPDVQAARRYWRSDEYMMAAERRNNVVPLRRPPSVHRSSGSTAVPPSVVALLNSRAFREGAMMSRRASAAMAGGRFGVRLHAGRIMCAGECP